MSWWNLEGGSNEKEVIEKTISKRPAQEADTEFARKVHHAAYHDVVEEQFGNFVETQQDEFFAKSWDASTHEILMHEGAEAGYCFVEQLPDHIFIHELVLSPEYQGKGIGTKVLQEVIKDAGAKKLPVRLQVLKKNRAQNLYLKLGFKKVGETDTHFKMELLP